MKELSLIDEHKLQYAIRGMLELLYRKYEESRLKFSEFCKKYNLDKPIKFELHKKIILKKSKSLRELSEKDGIIEGVGLIDLTDIVDAEEKKNLEITSYQCLKSRRNGKRAACSLYIHDLYR